MKKIILYVALAIVTTVTIYSCTKEKVMKPIATASNKANTEEETENTNTALLFATIEDGQNSPLMTESIGEVEVNAIASDFTNDNLSLSRVQRLLTTFYSLNSDDSKLFFKTLRQNWISRAELEKIDVSEYYNNLESETESINLLIDFCFDNYGTNLQRASIAHPVEIEDKANQLFGIQSSSCASFSAPQIIPYVFGLPGSIATSFAFWQRSEGAVNGYTGCLLVLKGYNKDFTKISTLNPTTPIIMNYQLPGKKTYGRGYVIGNSSNLDGRGLMFKNSWLFTAYFGSPAASMFAFTVK